MLNKRKNKPIVQKKKKKKNINILQSLSSHKKKGLILPIDMPGKYPTYKDNNKGITLCTVAATICELSILNRFETWVKKKKLFDEFQGASHTGCSILNTAWLLRETISYNIERGSKVYVCSLDTRKAFDSV